MKGKAGPAWQVVLSDLALILFLTTLAASGSGQDAPVSAAARAEGVSIYREGAGGLTLAQWLQGQPTDPRVQLTVEGRYSVTDFDRIADQTTRLANEASQSGFRPRLVLEPATESDVIVALGYDATPGQSQSHTTRLRPDSLAR